MGGAGLTTPSPTEVRPSATLRATTLAVVRSWGAVEVLINIVPVARDVTTTGRVQRQRVNKRRWAAF